MKKFFYLQMDSGADAPLLLSATFALGIKYASANQTKIYYNTSGNGDIVILTHDDDSSSPLKMQAFLVEEMRKLLSSPATDVAPLLIPPVPITSYSI